MDSHLKGILLSLEELVAVVEKLVGRDNSFSQRRRSEREIREREEGRK